MAGSGRAEPMATTRRIRSRSVQPIAAGPSAETGPAHVEAAPGAVVVIPALRPGPVLVTLVDRLEREGIAVVVVDDGSGESWRTTFDRCALAGAHVEHLPANHGKGYALRTAFALAGRLFPGAGVVTADADGQHTVEDILGVRAQLEADASRCGPLVLGVRSFGDEVPLRSRLGNAVSALAFRLAAGVPLADTQTGLRGIPAAHLAWAGTLPGDRYEYEYTMLVRAARDGIGLVQRPIATVYEDGNATSHFRPVRDSLRVLAPIGAFAASGLAAFALDTSLFWLLSAMGVPVWTALAGARLVSSSLNFSINRWWVFRGGRRVPLGAAVGGYGVLAAAVLAGGIGLVQLLSALGVPLLAAKVSADLVLFALSYAVQRLVVFAGPGRRPDPVSVKAGVEPEAVGSVR